MSSTRSWTLRSELSENRGVERQNQATNNLGHSSERTRPTTVLQSEMPSTESYQSTDDSKEWFRRMLPTNPNLQVTAYHFLGVNSLAASARPTHLDFVSNETTPLKHGVSSTNENGRHGVLHGSSFSVVLRVAEGYVI